MNAVVHFAGLLPPEALRRLAALRVSRFDASTVAPRRDASGEEARELVIARWHDDLCGLLNALTRGELAQLVRAREARSPELRWLAWQRGAELERAGADIPRSLQPRPVLLGGHLVVQAAPRGLYPASETWPRVLPPPRAVEPPGEEPETLDELLAAADRVIGVRLGRRGRDKGAWGLRAASLLGVVERGLDEPDWRGDVELKTVPVARERPRVMDPSGPASGPECSGLWRVVEDPAIAMLGETAPLAKLQRTLWLARSDCEEGDATIIAWYLLDYDAEVARLVRRYLHARPKGPAGTEQRGLYLHKRFFADCGLLASLNGC